MMRSLLVRSAVLLLPVALLLGLARAAPARAGGSETAAPSLRAAAKPHSVVRLAQADDAYRPPYEGRYEGGAANSGDVYRPPASGGNDAYRPSDGYSSGGRYGSNSGYGSGSAYNSGPAPYPYERGGDDRSYQSRSAPPSGGYGEPYAPPPADTAFRRDDGYPEPRGPGPEDDSRYYTKNEIINAGHGFFGSISKGLANVIEYAFQKAGRPNGYILGEDAGGAFVAGLRYGEGRLYTKDAGSHKVYWQGPSVGYDFGGAGAKTMVLVYNLRDPSEVYHRFAGVEGSAYLVGGVSIQFQKHGDVIMAPIRAGVGLRLGANVGYLKYTRSPTWNPF